MHGGPILSYCRLTDCSSLVRIADRDRVHLAEEFARPICRRGTDLALTFEFD